MPQPTYGFSDGLMSIAMPYACIDQWPLRLPPVQGEGTACRQSNDPVMSRSAGCCPPYTCTSRMWWIGKRSEEHTSELQSHSDLVCRLLLEKKKQTIVKFTVLWLTLVNDLLTVRC